MLLKFTKMHGLGNDFVVIDAISQVLILTSKEITALASRHLGIGFDQLLILRPSSDKKAADFYYEIYNADGSQAEQCGNGVRCIAKFLIDNQLSTKKKLRIAAKAGVMVVEFQESGDIRVNMGQPILAPDRIPFNRRSYQPTYALQLFEAHHAIMAASMGNPHAILQVASVEQAEIDTLGPRIATHRDFPQGCNVSFMQVLSPDHIRLRVYERGVGETLACGSAACATVVSGILNQLLSSQVTVELACGKLMIEWQGESYPVYMTGPAQTVFQGEITLPLEMPLRGSQ